MYTGPERRKYKRIKKQFIVKFQVRRPDPATFMPDVNEHIPVGWNMVTTRNLGAGGLLFNYDKKIKPDTLLDFKINFPTSRTPIDCVAKVLRVEEIKNLPILRIAAVFVEIGEEAKELINTAAEEFYTKRAEIEP